MRISTQANKEHGRNLFFDWWAATWRALTRRVVNIDNNNLLPIPSEPSYELQFQFHSTPLQYKPQFIKGFPSTFPAHHLSFKHHMIDKAVIVCGLQDSEPRDVEAQSRASHDQKVGNSDSEHGPVKQARI
jgi:hypothetical protein